MKAKKKTWMTLLALLAIGGGTIAAHSKASAVGTPIRKPLNCGTLTDETALQAMLRDEQQPLITFFGTSHLGASSSQVQTTVSRRELDRSKKFPASYLILTGSPAEVLGRVNKIAQSRPQESVSWMVLNLSSGLQQLYLMEKPECRAAS